MHTRVCRYLPAICDGDFNGKSLMYSADEAKCVYETGAGGRVCADVRVCDSVCVCVSENCSGRPKI